MRCAKRTTHPTLERFDPGTIRPWNDSTLERFDRSVYVMDVVAHVGCAAALGQRITTDALCFSLHKVLQP
jgi:hypothetical protein